MSKTAIGKNRNVNHSLRIFLYSDRFGATENRKHRWARRGRMNHLSATHPRLSSGKVSHRPNLPARHPSARLEPATQPRRHISHANALSAHGTENCLELARPAFHYSVSGNHAAVSFAARFVGCRSQASTVQGKVQCWSRRLEFAPLGRSRHAKTDIDPGNTTRLSVSNRPKKDHVKCPRVLPPDAT
jgi:hypothetical protein